MQKLYIGTKVVTGEPMTRAAYNVYRGWPLPADEDGSDPGYLVEYQDGGNSNHPDHTGYISWSPKDVFDRSYKPATGLDFGMAVRALKMGKRISRQGWNGAGMWVFLLEGSNQLASIHGFGFGEYLNEPTFRDAMFMKTVDNQLVPWTVSQTDALAEDWEIVE